MSRTQRCVSWLKLLPCASRCLAFVPVTLMTKNTSSHLSIKSLDYRKMRAASFMRYSDIGYESSFAFWQSVFSDGDKLFNDRAFKRPIHFNNAGASPSPKPVLRTVAQHMANEATMGGYLAASIAQPQLDAVYKSVASLLNTRCVNDNPREEIALVESATVAWTRIFYSMADSLVKRSEKIAPTNSGLLERVILVSEAEYAANIVAAVKFARDQNERVHLTNVRWKVLSIPSVTYVDKQGETKSSGVVDLDVLKMMLFGKGNAEADNALSPESIGMVCITHIPTNSGIVNPVNAIGELIAEHNKHYFDDSSSLPKCFYLVDACQSAGQIQLDVQRMQCHALAATGRKYLRGPRGTGFLFVQSEIAAVLQPSHIDHSSSPVKRLSNLRTDEEVSQSIDLTEQLDYIHRQGAARFEFWESNIAGKLGLGAAIDYALNEVGIDVIEKRITYLGAMLRNRLVDIEGIIIHHHNIEINENASNQSGIVVFSLDSVQSDKVRESLIKSTEADGTYSFEISIVPATSTPVDSAKTSAHDFIRASLSYFNTEEQIDLFCDKLGSIL